MENQNIDSVILTFLEGKATINEIELLRKWLSEDKKNQNIFDSVKLYWESSIPGVKSLNADQAYARLKAKSFEGSAAGVVDIHSRNIKSKFSWQKIAAAVLLLISFSGSLYYFIQINQLKNQAIGAKTIIKSNPNGVKSQIKLPDGTDVWLNAASSISYPQDFTDSERVVNLVGEAYFAVVKDKTRPFQVTSGQVVTTALGTSFNINSFKEENIKVSLTSGKVDVLRNDMNKQVILLPGQQANSNESGLSVAEFENKTVLAWKDGTIIFDNTEFDEMTRVLERWYNVKFKVHNLSDEERAQLVATVKFENQTIKDVLNVLGHTMKFEYTIHNKIITISFNEINR